MRVMGIFLLRHRRGESRDGGGGGGGGGGGADGDEEPSNKPVFLASATDVSSVSFFKRGGVREFLFFTARNFAATLEPNLRATCSANVSLLAPCDTTVDEMGGVIVCMQLMALERVLWMSAAVVLFGGAVPRVADCRDVGRLCVPGSQRARLPYQRWRGGRGNSFRRLSIEGSVWHDCKAGHGLCAGWLVGRLAGWRSERGYGRAMLSFEPRASVCACSGLAWLGVAVCVSSVTNRNARSTRCVCPP